MQRFQNMRNVIKRQNIRNNLCYEKMKKMLHNMAFNYSTIIILSKYRYTISTGTLTLTSYTISILK